MTRTALALLLTLLPAIASAQVTAPWLIGYGFVESGTTLTITTTALCPAGSDMQVYSSQVGGKSGSGITATDSADDIIQAGGGEWKGSGFRGTFLASTSPEQPTTYGLPIGSTITLTYTSTASWKGAIAVCFQGANPGSGNADNVLGTITSSGSNNSPALIMSGASAKEGGEVNFVATTLIGDSADTWTEAPGWTTLYVLQDANTIVLAYQLLPSSTVNDYAATNSATRQWIVGNRAYFPMRNASGPH